MGWRIVCRDKSLAHINNTQWGSFKDAFKAIIYLQPVTSCCHQTASQTVLVCMLHCKSNSMGLNIKIGADVYLMWLGIIFAPSSHHSCLAPGLFCSN